MFSNSIWDIQLFIDLKLLHWTSIDVNIVFVCQYVLELFNISDSHLNLINSFNENVSEIDPRDFLFLLFAFYF